MVKLKRLVLVTLFLSTCAWAVPSFGQSSGETGKLRIQVEPKQAYVFVDGKAIRGGQQTVALSAGDHQVAVYNYGYADNVQTVHIANRQTTNLRVTLQASGQGVSGPFGDIELKGDPQAAVLLTGDTPDYFVGRVHEVDWNWLFWHRRLLLKPGTYQLTVTREGMTLWSGPVTLKAGERVTVHTNKNGQTKINTWKKGETLQAQERFRDGFWTKTVAVAPPTSTLAASDTQLTCGQATNLAWTSTEAVDTSISGLGEVPKQGGQSVMPLQGTTYTLTAKGPGGESIQTLSINVNTEPDATITLSQSEVRYHKIGDRVVQQDSSTLQWSATNANSVKLEPFDNSALSGTQTVTAEPKQTSQGPISEDVTYTLTVQNACGGSTTKTATLHIAGSIDPPPAVTLASLFYPTAYPTRSHPQVGLLASEEKTLTDAADQFKNYEQYEGKASLVIVGHADVRGPESYNQALSERRANLVKNFLVSKGIPAEKIETRAEGKKDQIDEKAVEALISDDQQQPTEWMKAHPKSTWLAYNRRIDIVLQPTGQESVKAYPNASPDARLLWQRPIATLQQIEQASGADSVQQTSANTPVSRN